MQIRRAVPLGSDDDIAFDERLPAQLQLHSPSHFTPVDVARHAAALLAPRRDEIVLDVGAGPGKFCLVAAEAYPDAMFVGVELRERLVRVAIELAAESNLSNARFIHADAFDVDWSLFDAFYFYNPFAEHLFETTIGRIFAIDNTIELRRERFEHYIAATLERLAAARGGTRVVTYHGLGAEMPLGYELRSVVSIGMDDLELWQRTQGRVTRPLRSAGAAG